MHEFKVWAPRAKRVAVKVGEATYEMQCSKEQWTARVPEAECGADYAFLLDDDPKPYPDPRSLRQPQGVHAASRLYDQSAFEWHDERLQAPPLSGSVIYELHVGTFTGEGTFDAAIDRLDYLAELGVTHVELMPVAEFPGGQGWGYDGVALFAVRESYGGPDGLKRLVDACHQRGLSVLLDVVYNHFGPVGNYTGKFGPYLTDRHCTPWGGAINFEGRGSDEVRRYFCDNALMWLRDFHIDGLRLDAVHELIDRSAVHFLEQLSIEVELLSAQLERRLVLIAESDLNDPRLVTSREAHGYGLDAQWSDDFHHALFTLLHIEKGKGYYEDFGRFADLAKSLTEAFVYDGRYSVYRGHHHGRTTMGLSAHHFLGYIQNHDQVGNRAGGERLAHMIGLDRAKLGLGLVMTAPFIPMLFQGEEFASSNPFQYFADHEDPEMAKAVSEGRKREFAAFGWKEESIPDPEKKETFLRSKLNWDEIHEGEHGEMLEWTRSLIQLRRGSASLNDGEMSHVKVEFDEVGRWLTMRRGAILTMCNLGEKPVELKRPEGFSLRLHSKAGVEVQKDRVRVPVDGFVVLSAETD